MCKHLQNFYRYNYYCTSCGNICKNCSINCKYKGHFLYDLFNDMTDMNKKIEYISKEIKKLENQIMEDKRINIEAENNTEFLNDLEKRTDNINNINENIIEMDSLLNYEEDYSIKEFYLKLFKIIINDYKYYPNYTHFKNIDNIVNFFQFPSFDRIKEIILKYSYSKENTLKLFGEIFTKINHENFFLIIKKKS